MDHLTIKELVDAVIDEGVFKAMIDVPLGEWEKIPRL